MQIQAKPIHIDYDNFRILLSITYIDETIFTEIEEAIKDDISYIFDGKKQKKISDKMSDPQRKKWWAMMTHIIKELNKKDPESPIAVNAANIYALHTELKKTFLPIKMVEMGTGKHKMSVPIVASLVDTTKEQMTHLIEETVSMYSELGIEF